MPRCTHARSVAFVRVHRAASQVGSSHGQVLPRACQLSITGRHGVMTYCAFAHAVRNHTHRRTAGRRDAGGVKGLARQNAAGFAFAMDVNELRERWTSKVELGNEGLDR
jgi:hypothetical protein